jgi:hypothetical protein
MNIVREELTCSQTVVSEEAEITERSPRATGQISGIPLTLQPMGPVHLNAHVDYFIYTNSCVRNNPKGIPFEPETH